MSENDVCATCCQPNLRGRFHPYLYCLLWMAGIRDQEAFLRDSGFVREKARVASGGGSGTTKET